MSRAASIPRLVLSSGARIPALGFGTFLAKKQAVQEAVEVALDIGYRHIDTAISYQNEAYIGDVVAHHIRTQRVSRKDLFLTTKIPPVYMDPVDVRPQLLESLERLQTRYVDMLLIHFPVGSENLRDGNIVPLNAKGERLAKDIDYLLTWKEMEQLVKEGKVNAIGLSNFSCDQVEKILRMCEIPPSNLQLECHAYLQQNNIRKFAKRENIVLTGYSPIGAPGRPESQVMEGQKTLLEDSTVLRIADDLKCSPAQLLIKFVSKLGVVPLPKSVTPSRIIENFQSFEIDIPDHHFETLKLLDCGEKYFNFTWAQHMTNFPQGDF